MTAVLYLLLASIGLASYASAHADLHSTPHVLSLCAEVPILESHELFLYIVNTVGGGFLRGMPLHSSQAWHDLRFVIEPRSARQDANTSDLHAC